MAVIPKVWGAPSVEYATDGYGGADADVTTLATLCDIDFENTGNHGVSLKVKVNSSGTTDNFQVFIDTSDDGVEFDTLHIQSYEITATSGNDSIASFLVPAPAPFLRIRGQRSGVTDTFDVEVTVTPFTYGA